jgi:hypothetical protein
MPVLSVAFPLIIAAVLIASAIGKFRHPDDIAGWVEIGVPRAFQQDWLRRLHPWGELVLGVAVAVLGSILGVIAAVVAVLLMAAYTWLVARTVMRSDDASCACFGARRPVTRVTVVRNVWLSLVAIAAAITVWATPLLGGALVAGVAQWQWLIGLVVAAATAGIILWPEAEGAPEPAAPALVVPTGDDDLDYVRTRIPAVPVTAADGTVHNLRTLAARKPMLLLAVSPTCSPCVPVIAKVPEWRELLPELDVRMLLRRSPEDSELVELDEPQTLHDPEGYVAGSIQDWGTPTAVLLGADGLLAGGPVSGPDDIPGFIDDIFESLHGERPVAAD